MRFRAYIAAVVLAVVGTHASAQTVGYTEVPAGAQTQGVLYRVNLTTRTAAAIGAAGSFGGQPLTIVGLTFDPAGTLFGVSVTTPAYLVTISKSSGAASIVGTLSGISQPDASLAALAFTCDGALWMSSAQTNNFWHVDPKSGATTLVGNLGSTVTGLAANGANLYGTGGAGSKAAMNNFYKIDTGNASLSTIGAFGGSSWIGVVSPAFDKAGDVWALIDTLAINGNTLVQWNSVAQINPSTGALTKSGEITQPASLAYLPMRGLAVTPPVCAKDPGLPGALGAAPTLSRAGLALLILMLLASVAIVLPGQYKNRRE